MKRCPRCQQTYTDETLQFCRMDGAPLDDSSIAESATTLALPDPHHIAEKSTHSIHLPPSIAVLPFANISADAENEYFCDGLAEELINALTKIESLRVVARTSAFSFKGKEADVREIGRKLNVDIVLEGSVRKAGNKLRITAQLVKVSDGYHLWSERYDREIEDIFAIQDDLSLAIVSALRVKLLKDEKTALLKRYKDNLQAYNLYLKGRYFWNKLPSSEDLKKGIDYFQQAIEEDPNYALAYAGLADSYAVLGSWENGTLPPREAMPKAEAAAQKRWSLTARFPSLTPRWHLLDFITIGTGRNAKRNACGPSS
jgi:TolB-like protein